jgi:hypothetical protein
MMMSRIKAADSQTSALAATLTQASNASLILVPMSSLLQQLDRILFGAPTVAALAAPFPPELTDQGDLLLWERAEEVTDHRQEFRKRRIGAVHLEMAVSHLLAKQGDLALSTFRIAKADYHWLHVTIEDLTAASVVTTPPIEK